MWFAETTPLFKKGRIPAFLIFFYSHTNRTKIMAKRLDPSELVEFKELLMANSIQVDAPGQLLIEMGIITTDEFFTKMKEA